MPEQIIQIIINEMKKNNISHLSIEQLEKLKEDFNFNK